MSATVYVYFLRLTHKNSFYGNQLIFRADNNINLSPTKSC